MTTGRTNFGFDGTPSGYTYQEWFDYADVRCFDSQAAEDRISEFVVPWTFAVIIFLVIMFVYTFVASNDSAVKYGSLGYVLNSVNVQRFPAYKLLLSFLLLTAALVVFVVFADYDVIFSSMNGMVALVVAVANILLMTGEMHVRSTTTLTLTSMDATLNLMLPNFHWYHSTKQTYEALEDALVIYLTTGHSSVLEDNFGLNHKEIELIVSFLKSGEIHNHLVGEYLRNMVKKQEEDTTAKATELEGHKDLKVFVLPPPCVGRLKKVCSFLLAQKDLLVVALNMFVSTLQPQPILEFFACNHFVPPSHPSLATLAHRN